MLGGDGGKSPLHIRQNGPRSQPAVARLFGELLVGYLLHVCTHMRHGWSLSNQPRARKDRACALARRERTFHRMILDLMVADAGLGSLDIDGGLVSTRIANAAFGTKRRSIVQRSQGSSSNVRTLLEHLF